MRSEATSEGSEIVCENEDEVEDLTTYILDSDEEDDFDYHYDLMISWYIFLNSSYFSFATEIFFIWPTFVVPSWDKTGTEIGLEYKVKTETETILVTKLWDALQEQNL